MNDIDELQRKIEGLTRVVNLLLKPLGKELCKRCDGQGCVDHFEYGHTVSEFCPRCSAGDYRDGPGVASIEESK